MPPLSIRLASSAGPEAVTEHTKLLRQHHRRAHATQNLKPCRASLPPQYLSRLKASPDLHLTYPEQADVRSISKAIPMPRCWCSAKTAPVQRANEPDELDPTAAYVAMFWMKSQKGSRQTARRARPLD